MVQPATESEFRWALTYARPYGRRLAVLSALSTVEIGLRVLSPWPLKAVIDVIFGGTPPPAWLTPLAARLPGASMTGPVRLLVTIVLAGVLIQLAHQLVIMLHGRLQVTTSQRMVRFLRERLFSHLQWLTFSQHARTPTGDAVHRLEADARCVDQIVFRGFFPLIFSCATLVVMFGVLARIHVPLALVSVSIVPPLYVWLRFYSRRMAPAADRARELDSRLSERLYESFSTIRLVKSHAREDFEIARFSGVAAETARAWIHLGRRSAVFSVVVATLTIVGSSLVLLFGGISVLRGAITPGTLLLVLAYLGFVYGPLSAIASTTGELQQAFASARRVRAAFALNGEASAVTAGSVVRHLRGDIAFEDVRFEYEAGRPVLDGVSFRAVPGETIAVVGPSGSGKSTLVSLLPRFYEPTTGRVLIDGVDVRDYDLRSLRRTVAVVLQEAVVMSGSVLTNLRYGRLDATNAEVERAARAANAHDFIAALPHGYASNLGEAGVGLSGGEKQRLSIARAFLKDAPILILDEPTAALDPISEWLVMDALKRLRAGRTTFIIAHRLTTVREADRILVLEAGRVVGAGTHDGLLANSPLYQRMCRQFVRDQPHAGAEVAAS